MARYPGAIWKPITADKLYGPGIRPPLTVWNRVNIHSTASTASSQFNYFNRSGIPDSHFHVAYDGVVEQYVDTDMQAFADLDGSDATISIETQGVSESTGDEEWRSAQAEAIAKLIAWIMETHPIPRKLAIDSKIGTSSHGLSWHRLGIDGNFPALPSIQAGRLQRGGGMHYSEDFGKVCPGYKRITQIFSTVWPRTQAILDGTGGFLMTLSSDEENTVLAAANRILEIDSVLIAGAKAASATITDSTLKDEVGLSRALERLITMARRNDNYSTVAELALMVQALTSAVQTLLTTQGVDPVEAMAMLKTAAEDALSRLSLKINPEIQ